MPPGSSLFLGLELAVDQLRASLVDESLDLVGVECVDFDTELSEYQTQGGIFTTPGDAYTTPVEMWIKALDILFQKLQRNYDLTRIKSIGGAAQHALVWWKSTTVPSLSSLDPHTPLVSHFSSAHFSLPNTPVAQDISSHTHALTIEALIGGPDHMAARVGGAAHPSNLSAQLLRVRETWPQDVWARTGRVQLASAFLASLVAGKWMPMAEAEACASGMWSHTTGTWDEGILDIVGGSREEGRRVRGWLGDVDVGGGARRAGNIARYLVERYGFDPETGVTPFTSDGLAAYLSLAPAPSDAVLQFGPMDVMMCPAQHYIPTRLYSLFPHPAQDPSEKRRYIAVLTNRNADVPRALVRDMYTKSWSAFDRLVAIVPPGGSIGLDDKLFAFWHLQGDAHPFAHVKGIYRFETGIKVTEFRDLRANPRCLLESQVLSLRVKYAKMLATGVLARAPTAPSTGATAHSNTISSIPTRSPTHRPAPPVSSALGLAFDPYDPAPLPTRVLATGAAANFPAVANLVCDVFNAPVFVPQTQLASAQRAPHRNAPAAGCPSRGALGAAYVARWVWGREWGVGAGAGGGAGFEEDVRRLLGKRWAGTGGAPLRASLHGAPGTAPGSGASTPFTRPPPARAANVLLEEEEDEEAAREMEMERELMGRRNGGGNGGRGSPGVIGAPYGADGLGITPSSSGSSLASLSTAYTTPELAGALGMLSPGLGSGLIGTNGSAAAGTPTTPTPLTPVVPMPTGEAEAMVGLAKVAEPDADAFLAYAAIVPEYCRLEGMLVKGIV
ncbi:actin-like ATPase domain-containing protein [Mycena rosella]|uniref:Actin-like ATPase domain-containing protein n=1 Tax=Mycena rosella TaxID=1033263 RepID=A0AAD7BPN7_MYCRO|nr:actin-like ATPase domain-containing protein [Mycena rosella]